MREKLVDIIKGWIEKAQNSPPSEQNVYYACAEQLRGLCSAKPECPLCRHENDQFFCLECVLDPSKQNLFDPKEVKNGGLNEKGTN